LLLVLASMVIGGLIHGNLHVFDGNCYEDWCVKMEAILDFQEVVEIVKKGFQEPSKNVTDELECIQSK